MQSEVVVRVGADTSGFKKGVDDVAAQTARMRNDMRVAFDAGVGGSRNVRTAFKAMLDVAGQSGGPLAQMLGGIKDIFNSFKVNPMLGAVSAIGAAVTAAGKLAEKAADNALKKTSEAVASMRRSQAILRMLNPELLDPVQQARTRAAGLIEGGQLGVVQALAQEEQKKADAITARERTRLQRLPQIDIEAAALRSRISNLGTAVGPGGQMSPQAIAEMAQATKELKKLEEERAGLAETPAQEKSRQQEAKQIEERIQIYRDAEKEILEVRKKEAEDLAKEQERANKKSQEEQKRANSEQMSIERDSAIKRAEMADKTGEQARKKKEEFIKEDLEDAKKRAASSDPAISARARADIARLENEQLNISSERLTIQSEQQSQSEKRKEQIKQSARDLAIEQEKTRSGKLQTKEKFIREDLEQVQKGMASKDVKIREESIRKWIDLQTEAIAIQRQIKKNTAGGARG